MSVQQYLIDASTRHQVFLQRYAGGESKKAIKTLNRLRRDIMARLAQEPTVFQRSRLEEILRDIDKVLANGFQEITSQVKMSSYDLAKSEAEFSTGLFNKTSTTNFALPAESALIAAVDNKPMTNLGGRMLVTVDDALKDYSLKVGNKVRQSIRDGVVLGRTTPEIAKGISTELSTLRTRQLETLVRTATNHASAVARDEVYTDNSRLLDGYEWVSTLDSRTTFICGSRDGKVYQAGIGPVPPAHWGCRSTTVPKVKQDFQIPERLSGKRWANGPDGKGNVNANLSYGTWLKRQPKEFIDEALGPERSSLFRSGKLKIDQFVDPTGRVYTLKQLENMYPIELQQ